MSIGAILVGTGLSILSVFFVAAPLVNKKGKKPASADIKTPAISNQYEETLIALRDLDFDHSTGKIIDEDYVKSKSGVVGEGCEGIGSQNSKREEA